MLNVALILLSLIFLILLLLVQVVLSLRHTLVDLSMHGAVVFAFRSMADPSRAKVVQRVVSGAAPSAWRLFDRRGRGRGTLEMWATALFDASRVG